MCKWLWGMAQCAHDGIGLQGAIGQGLGGGGAQKWVNNNGFQTCLGPPGMVKMAHLLFGPFLSLLSAPMSRQRHILIPENPKNVHEFYQLFGVCQLLLSFLTG